MNTYEQVTARILEQLENGAAPWVKPWKNTGVGNEDTNVVSGKGYRGINRLLLGMSGYTGTRWGTFNQWLDKGASVRKGQKATHIVFFKPMTKETQGADGATEQEKFAILKGYCVFNEDQCDNVTPLPVAPIPSNFDALRDARCEATIKATGAKIQTGGDTACFIPSLDLVRLPPLAAYGENGIGHYYATAFHELTHWTGARDRLNRLQTGRFGNPAYAFEELVAELGAAFLCDTHNVQGELRHAGYIASWIKCLKDDSRAIFKAAALAQKAADYVQGIKDPAAQIAA